MNKVGACWGVPSTLRKARSVVLSAEPRGLYRPRNPRATPLYRIFDSLFDEVRGQWEERFERRYGFWWGFVADLRAKEPEHRIEGGVWQRILVEFPEIVR